MLFVQPRMRKSAMKRNYRLYFVKSVMDVMRPPILTIGKRFYRKNPIKQLDADEGPYQEEDQYMEEDVYADEVCDAFTQVEQTENGYRICLSVPSAYYGYIIGKKGETRRRIENETRTQIRIPKQGEEGSVVIVGRDRKGVLSAKTRVDVLVDSARQKQPFTHFLSFPMNSAEIKEAFAEFKEEVLQECEMDRGLDDTIFQNPDKLHLTIGTLALMNESEINTACNMLKQCKEDIIDPLLRGIPLDVEIAGLEYMNDDPGAVDVLYAQVQLQDGSDRLQVLADRLVSKFTSTGLMQKEHDRVKLHVTVMNTLMRKDPSGTSIPRGSNKGKIGINRESFNAANVLRTWGNNSFGKFTIGELHLSQRYSTGCDGYYACAGKLELPT